MASNDPKCDLFVTRFEEFPRGTYEFRKAQALSKHLRLVAERVANAQQVSICSGAPGRPWVGLREWDSGPRRVGEWFSDLDIVSLP